MRAPIEIDSYYIDVDGRVYCAYCKDIIQPREGIYIDREGKPYHSFCAVQSGIIEEEAEEENEDYSY